MHPFDNIPRIPTNAGEPATMKLDWDDWMKTMAEEPPEGLKKGKEILITENDVIDMNDLKVDDYLDWYQKTWIDERDAKRMWTAWLLFYKY
jgi:RNA polymerase I-specific transcription initiation factor RRN7